MQPSYGRPPYAAAPPAVSLTKARPWLVGFTAGATTLAIIVILGNPPVTRALLRHSVGGFGSRVLQSFTVFYWDFSRLDDPQHVYRANLVFDVLLIMLVVLLVAAVAVGRGGFWRTFLVVWLAVIVAGLLASYVRATMIDTLGTVPGDSIGTRTFFSQYSPGSPVILALMIFGLVVASVAALIAVVTRKREVIGAPAAVGQPERSEPAPTFAGSTDRREAWSAPPAPGPVANPSPWQTSHDRDGETTSRPDGDDDSDRTTALPVFDERNRGTGQPAGETVDDDGAQHTQALPRVDDEPPQPHS